MELTVWILALAAFAFLLKLKPWLFDGYKPTVTKKQRADDLVELAAQLDALGHGVEQDSVRRAA